MQVQSKVFSTNKTLNLRGQLLDLSTPKVMGILNVTPDSFYDGGRFASEKAVLNQTEIMLAEGAAFIDVGGYSTRPGAAEISPEEERARLIPVIRLIQQKFPEAVISADTFRAETARQAVLEGASIVNDISGGDLDPDMFSTIAALKVPYCVMHMRGTPATMTGLTEYTDLILEVVKALQAKISKLHSLGVVDIIVDPGFGFAKTREQNFQLLDHLDYFGVLGQPVLAGLSRKSLVWKTLGTGPEEALNGTTSLNTIALMKGAAMLRVHDVREAVESIRLVSLTRSATTTHLT